ncbi:MAG: hypothetical protein CMK09_11110 [Ponticaulis sp.]|nr:hypothetical protein [Ponticaulis sp.]|tara:strand:- start:57873 stop:59354 length:1482 start_codon:yes stop_codon:yes gene_type:complete
MLRLLSLSAIAFLKLSVLVILMSMSPPTAEAQLFGLPGKNECSAEGQEPCPVTYRGERCDSWLSEQGGTCQPCGREDQPKCPAIKSGYPCKGKLEPDSSNVCKPCGGQDEKACRTFKEGARCDGDLEIIDGYCKVCGIEGAEACPTLASGYPCKGKTEPDGNNICQPCGGEDQKACRTFKPGKRCDDGLANFDGTCRPCGGPDERACPRLMSGYPCEGHYEPNDNGYCKPCGGIGEKACRWGKADKPCFKEGAASKGEWGVGVCIEDPNYVPVPIRFYNGSNQSVWVSFYTWNPGDQTYENIGGANVAADTVREIPIAGLNCEFQMRDQVLGSDPETAGTTTILRSTLADEDYCEPKIFHAVIWDKESHMVGDAIGTMNMLNDEVPAGGSTSDLWNMAVHQNSYVSNSKIRGIALDLPQEYSWVSFWGRNIHPDTAIVDAEGISPNAVGQELFTAPSNRSTRHYKTIALTGRDADDRPVGDTLNVNCGPGVCW